MGVFVDIEIIETPTACPLYRRRKTCCRSMPATLPTPNKSHLSRAPAFIRRPLIRRKLESNRVVPLNSARLKRCTKCSPAPAAPPESQYPPRIRLSALGPNLPLSTWAARTAFIFGLDCCKKKKRHTRKGRKNRRKRRQHQKKNKEEKQRHQKPPIRDPP